MSPMFSKHDARTVGSGCGVGLFRRRCKKGLRSEFLYPWLKEIEKFTVFAMEKNTYSFGFPSKKCY